MSVVSIHPEDLLDKLARGDLTSTERELLSAHLASCDVCRFELTVSVDLEDEAKHLTSSGPPTRLFPPALAPRQSRLAPERRRSRRMIWFVAAALVITATGALASVSPVGRSFLALLQAQPVESALAPSAAPPAPSSARAGRAGSRAEEGESAVEASPSSGPTPSAASPPAPPAARAPSRAPERRAPAPAEPAPPAESAASLFAEANQARRRGDSTRAAALYRRLQSEFPRSPEAELSQVTLSMLLLDRGDAAGALSGFDSYLSRPRRGLEAEALVGRARALRALGSFEAEAGAWREVLRRYPNSVYAKQATDRLSALGQP
jgi:TolA-binding protein